MRLKSFQVKRYRSIQSTFEIESLENLTIVGPNNEGKSNLVTALVTALQLLEEYAVNTRAIGFGRALARRLATRIYEWDRDYPLRQQVRADGVTEFKLKFLLDEDDQAEFFKFVKSSINDTLPITVKIGRDRIPIFEVNKQGRGYASLNEKSALIAAFIGSRLSINYIPAIRTARDSARSIEGLVSSALRSVERSKEYTAALKTIEDLQRPVLLEIENRLKESLNHFVPSVRGVRLEVREGRSQALRSVQISIDDGELTPLSSKGDGIISLAAMALLSRLDTIAQKGVSLVLVIEEPESHLHPKAVNAIRNTLDGLADNIQVIITTHSPNLVSRARVRSNIIVENNIARVASSIKEIRDVLGVRVSDNLTNARVNVLCEGLTECRILPVVLPQFDSKLDEPVKNGEVCFSNLRGASNLSYMANALQNSVCEPFCILDSDEAGRRAFDAARADGIIGDQDAIFTSLLGKTEAEFEDLLDLDVVGRILQQEFGIITSSIPLPSTLRSKKFTERMRHTFTIAGKVWNADVESTVKTRIGDECVRVGLSAFSEASRPILGSIALAVKQRLDLQ